MRIKDLKPRTAITVTREETLRAAAKHLADDDDDDIAVVVLGAVGAVGIFSERDLARSVADGADLDEEPLDEYMTEAPVTVPYNSGLRGGHRQDERVRRTSPGRGRRARRHRHDLDARSRSAARNGVA